MLALRKNLFMKDESGFTLVEVLVSMMIFAIIAIGVSYSLVSMMTQVRDARFREVATNLAAKEIDLARSITDVMAVKNIDRPVAAINGQNYTVRRSAQWITDATSSGSCGVTANGTGGELAYKNVTVTVSWPSSAGGTRSVSSSTLIAPTERVSSATAGTIVVSIKNAEGRGAAGVAISVTPALATTPPNTDSDGCIYLKDVVPGSYTVKVTSAGYIDNAQKLNPFKLVSPAAGKSSGASFQASPKQKLTLRYPGAQIPKNLVTSLLHSSDPAVFSAATSSSSSRSVDVYPFGDGYRAVAGQYVSSNEGTAGCLSPNPETWTAGTRNGVAVAAAPLTTVLASPTASLDIGLGAVGLTSNRAATTVTAVSELVGPADSGDPGCGGLTMTYQFDVSFVAGTKATLSLPFGSWRLYYGTSVTPANLIKTGLTASTVTGDIVTLDPRVKVVP